MHLQVSKIYGLEHLSLLQKLSFMNFVFIKYFYLYCFNTINHTRIYLIFIFILNKIFQIHLEIVYSFMNKNSSTILDPSLNFIFLYDLQAQEKFPFGSLNFTPSFSFIVGNLMINRFLLFQGFPKKSQSESYFIKRLCRL